MLAAIRRRAASVFSARSLSQLASRIGEEERAAFARDGAVCVRGAFSAEWVERLRAGAEENLCDPGPLCDEHAQPGQPGRFHDDQFLWRRRPVFRDFVFNSQAAALARAFTGSKSVHIFYDQLFVKEPGTVNPTPWHTDHSYWGLSGGHVLSLWAPLDSVPGATAVRYVAGSHKAQLKHKIASFSGDQSRYSASAAFPDPPDVDSLVASGQARLLQWDVAPGDVIVFDSYSVHGASGNSSASVRRRAYATRWATEEVRYDDREGTMNGRVWKLKGGKELDCGLAHGAALECGLHPTVPTAL